MQKSKLFAAAMIVALMTVVAPPATTAQEQQQWTFDEVGRVEIDGLSGSLVVRPGSGDGVLLDLEQHVRPRDGFRAEVDENGGRVQVRERWSGGATSGEVRWTLTVPASSDLVISFDTASGGLEASGVSARFDFDTASGDIELRDMTIADGSSFDTASGDYELTDVVVGEDVDMDTASGDFEILRVRAGWGFSASTASGDVTVEDSEGILDAGTASGNVRVSGTRLAGPAEFSSASGDVAVTLDDQPEDDLELSSASGDVRLDAELGDNFTLVIEKRNDRGRIDSSIEPDETEHYERNGRPWVRQTVVRGSGGPTIRLHTATGSIRLRTR